MLCKLCTSSRRYNRCCPLIIIAIAFYSVSVLCAVKGFEIINNNNNPISSTLIRSSSRSNRNIISSAGSDDSKLIIGSEDSVAPSSVTVEQSNIYKPLRPSRLRSILFYGYPKEDELFCSSDAQLDVSTKSCLCEGHLCHRKPIAKHVEVSCHEKCCANGNGDYQKLAELNEYGHRCRLVEVKKNTMPWMVELKTNGSRSLDCQGSLIHPRVVLTTTVCILMQWNKNITARIRISSNKVVQRYVAKRVFHENFRDAFEKKGFNIALLLLDTDVFNMRGEFAFTCLPSMPMHNAINDQFDNRNCVLLASRSNSSPVKVHNVRILSGNECQHALLRQGNSVAMFNPEANFCVQMNEKRPLFDISSNGVQLMCSGTNAEIRSDDQFELTGMLMWSSRYNSAPFIFTNVAYFRQWINESLHQNGIQI